MAALPEIEKQWQEGANLIRNKERGIVQNRYESISLKPAEFQLCVTREEFARLWKSSLRENTLQALGWAHLLESPNWLYKKWKSQLPKLCQARLENFVGTGSHIPCWSYQEIIDIKETCLKERLVSLFSTTHLPALLFTLLLSIELNKLLFACVWVYKVGSYPHVLWTAIAWVAASVNDHRVVFLPVHNITTSSFALCLELGV